MRFQFAARPRFGLAALMLPLLALGFAPRAWSKAPDGWKTDLVAVLNEAALNGKPVFAVFSAKGCPPCKQMAEEVLPSDKIKKALYNWNYVYVYWDSDAWHSPKPGEREPEAFTKYEVRSYPTLLIFSPSGEVQMRLEGGRSATALAKLLKNQPEYTKRKREIALKLAEHPDDAALHKAAGDAEMLINEYEAALDSFKQAAALDPDNKTGVATDVAFFSALPNDEDDLPRSLKDLTKFETDHPGSPYNPWARFYRGLISEKLGKKAEAIALLESGLKDFPDSDFAESTASALAEFKDGGAKSE